MAREVLTLTVSTLFGAAVAIAFGVTLHWPNGTLGVATIVTGLAGLVIADTRSYLRSR